MSWRGAVGTAGLQGPTTSCKSHSTPGHCSLGQKGLGVGRGLGAWAVLGTSLVPAGVWRDSAGKGQTGPLHPCLDLGKLHTSGNPKPGGTSAGLMRIPGGSGMKGILAAVFQQEIKGHWLLALGVQGARGGAVRAGRQGEQTPKSCGLQENCPSVLEALLHLSPPALPLPTTAPAVALVDVADATPWCSSTGLCRGLRARSHPCFSPQPHQMSCW